MERAEESLPTERDLRRPDTPSYPGIAVILPVRDSLPHLREALAAINQARSRYGGDIRVVAVDHDSSDGSRSYLRNSLAPGDTLIRSTARTVAGVRNEGAAQTEAEYLSFIDSDTVIPDDYFTKAVDVLSRTGATATGAMVTVPSSMGQLPHVWYRLQQNPESGPVHYLNSANFFVSRSAFRDVGGFDEKLESGEDSDICMRLRESGHQIVECLALTSLHLDNPTSFRAFFRQQVWHAQGMLSTVRWDELNKPLAATLVYGLVAFSALLFELLLSASVSPVRLALTPLLGTTAVAATSAGYRMIRARCLVDPVTATSLFHAYYISRWVALARIVATEFGLSRTTVTEG